jgi:uncharacterized protein (DUF433 family)/uncharacterized protein YuzE
MKIRYDTAADALTIAFQEGAATCRDLAEGLSGRYDAQGRLAGLEIACASQRLPDLGTLQELQVNGLGPSSAPPGDKNGHRFADMTTLATSHIRLDAEGRAWIDDSNVKVIEVVLDKIGHGLSPEEIHEEYPDLSLAQVHAAFSYYYDHKAEFDAEIDRQEREYETLRAAQGNDTPLHRRLRAAGKIP